MIHYHGGPITPMSCAERVWRSRHAFISFAHPDQLSLAATICQTFALDNGAFTEWKRSSVPKRDWASYYNWVGKWCRHPGFDFAVIPDIIGGSETENDELVAEWPHSTAFGAPYGT